MLLFPPWALSLALVAWTAAGSLRQSAGDRERLKRILLPACAALIGFGLMVSAIARVSPPWRQIDRLADGGLAVNDLLAAQRYVEANTHPGEHVLIIGTTLDHRVADRAGVVNVSPINGITGLIVPDEADSRDRPARGRGRRQVFESVSDVPGSGGLVIAIPELAGDPARARLPAGRRGPEPPHAYLAPCGLIRGLRLARCLNGNTDDHGELAAARAEAAQLREELAELEQRHRRELDELREDMNRELMRRSFDAADREWARGGAGSPAMADRGGVRGHHELEADQAAPSDGQASSA